MKKIILKLSLVSLFCYLTQITFATNVPIPRGSTVTYTGPKTAKELPTGGVAVVCKNTNAIFCAKVSKGIESDMVSVEVYANDGITIEQTYNAMNVTIDENAANEFTITVIPD